MIRSSPHWPAPGYETWPNFANPNVTVSEALIAAPMTAPVSEFTPDAISTATVGTANELTISIARRGTSFHLGVQPGAEDRVDDGARLRSPSAASRFASPTRFDRPCRRIARNSACARAASPFKSAARPSRTARTAKPSWISRRPATNPSPPLLPLPATTSTSVVAPGKRSTSASATASPARVISEYDGMPYLSWLRRSSSRLSAGVEQNHRRLSSKILHHAAATA